MSTLFGIWVVATAIPVIVLVILTTRLILVSTSEPKPHNMIQLPVTRYSTTGECLHTFMELPSASAPQRCKGLAVTGQALLLAIFGDKFLAPSNNLLLHKIGANSATLQSRTSQDAQPAVTLLPPTQVSLQGAQSGQNAQIKPSQDTQIEPSQHAQIEQSSRNARKIQKAQTRQLEQQNLDPIEAIKAQLGHLSQADRDLVMDYIADRPQLVKAILSDDKIVRLTICRTKNGQTRIRTAIRHV